VTHGVNLSWSVVCVCVCVC